MKTDEPKKSILEVFAFDAIEAPATVTGGGTRGKRRKKSRRRSRNRSRSRKKSRSRKNTRSRSKT